MGSAEKQAAFERGQELLLAGGWTGVCRWVGEWLGVAEETERERRGARRDRRNVRPMAALVCVRHSAQWQSYWTLAA